MNIHDITARMWHVAIRANSCSYMDVAFASKHVWKKIKIIEID